MQYFATHHALERFRERVDCRYAHLSQDELDAMLSARLAEETLLARDVVDPRHPASRTTLHLLSRADGFQYVCVVRAGVVVTVLDGWMAERNFPGWRNSTGARYEEVATP